MSKVKMKWNPLEYRGETDHINSGCRFILGGFLLEFLPRSFATVFDGSASYFAEK